MNKTRRRRRWFTVHKWIGLILAVAIIPLSLSGAALVWGEALDRLVSPERYTITGASRLDLVAYVAAARARVGGEAAVAQLALPAPGDPVIVTVALAVASKPAPGPPPRTMVYLDPPTARVLGVADSRSGVVRTLHVLHGSLFVPGWGRTIVGWIGVAMLISSFTGLWLWWPTTARWAKGLRWKRHRNTDTNLHYMTGFWVALPLFVLSLTGAWISFPGFFGALVGEGAPPGPDRRTMMGARPLAHPALSVGAVVRAAGPLAKGELRTIVWPTDRSSDWRLAYAMGAVTVADDSGAAATAKPRVRRGVTGLMRRIHDGDDMGAVWQSIIFLGGVIPALLGVTGAIMWWRARTWRRELKTRQAAQLSKCLLPSP